MSLTIQNDFEMIKKATIVLVLFSPNLLTDSQAFEEMTFASNNGCTLLPIEIGKIGLDKFDYGKTPSITIQEQLSTFNNLKTSIARSFTPHGPTDQVSVQLKSIWGAIGLTSSSNQFRGVPFVRDPYAIAMNKALQFAPGTREWVFDQIKEVVNC